MAFPATQLPVRVYLAPGGAPASPESWVWVDITDDVLVRDGIVIEQGRPDEATDVDPGQCRLTLRNVAGKYSPRNPASEYFGRLDRNTPLRVTVETLADDFARTVTDGWGTADSGQAWTVTGTVTDYDVAGGAATAVYSSTGYRYGLVPGQRFADGDILLSWSWSIASVTGGPVAAAVLLRGSSEGDVLCFVHVATSGVMSAVVYDRQGLIIDSATLTPTYAQNRVYWLRVQASGVHVRMRVWEDGDPEPDAWGLTAQVYDLMPGYVAVGGYRFPANSNGGHVQSIRSVSVEAERYCGAVTAWPPRWDMSRNDEYTPIVAAGVLRRIGQGAGTAASALRRHWRHELAPTAYWPLEEGSTAVRGEPAVTSGRPMATAGPVVFGGSDRPPGSAAAVAVAAGDSMAGEVGVAASTTAWTVAWCLSRDSSSAAGSVIVTWETPGGSSGAVRWRATASITGGTLTVARVDDTGAATTVLTVSSLDWSAWSLVTVSCEEDGADLYVDATVEKADGSGDSGTGNATVAGQGTDAVTRVTVTTSGAGTSPCALICHIGVLAAFITADQLTALAAAASGWDAQPATDRVEAVCRQEGILLSTPAGDGGSTALGVQQPDPALSLLREAERSAVGLLYERGPGLAYLPRESRQAPSTPWPDVAGPLTVSFDELAEVPEPTDDDQRLRNSWTVSQRDGGQATVTDQASVDAVGLYDDTVTINTAYVGELRHQAGWRVHAGTVDDMRWPRVAFDLSRAAGLWDVWPGICVADRLLLTDPPDGLPPDDVRQVIEGWTEWLAPYSWRVALSASPAAAWEAHEYGDDTTAVARYDTAGAELAAGVTSSATALTVATTSGPLWTTAAADLPFDIRLGGERITVTAISGASSPQTFTCTRAVNGVTKAHDTGAAVELWTPTRYVY